MDGGEDMSKTMIVTGGSRGIGAAAAELAAKEGWSVAVAYHAQSDQAEQLVTKISQVGGRAISIQCNVALEGDVEALFERTESEFGPISAVINSAGVSIQSRVDQAEFANVRKMIDTNVLGVMFSCHSAVRRMSTKNGGSGGTIVNVSSMAATTGGREGASFYAATKGAVDVFTRGLAREIAREGVRVNAVRPGMTATDMVQRITDDPKILETTSATIPMGRLGEAHEIAAAAIWLCSDAASFVTGALIDVSGGGFVIGSVAD